MTARGPVFYMLIATLANSLIPMVVHHARGSENPFLFNAWLSLGVAGGCAIFLMTTSRKAGLRTSDIPTTLRHISRWPANRPMILATMGALDYGFFALSTRFIQIPVSVLLFEMYPIAIILMTSWIFRKTDRYHRLTPRASLPVILALSGLLFANASQLSGLGALTPAFLWTSLIGMTAIALGIASASMSVFGLKWGTNLSNELSRTSAPRDTELHCAVIAFLVVSLISIPLNLGAGLLNGESITKGAALTAAGGGIAANAVASIA